MFNDIDYVDNKLNKSEKQLIEKFREEQDPDNLVIELNTYFNEYNLTTEANTYGVYNENGKYYIKYKDINFIDMNYDDNDTGYSTLAIINCNGYEIYLSEEMFPILYYDTLDDPRYNFSYLGEEELEDEIDVKYVSYADDTGLIIRYIKENNKIVDIKLEYLVGIKVDTEIKNESNNALGVISGITFILGGVVVIYFVSKRIRLSRSF